MNDPAAVPRKEKAFQLFSLAACIALLAWDIFKLRRVVVFSLSGICLFPLLAAVFFFAASFLISWKYVKPGAFLAFLASAAVLGDFFLRLAGSLRLYLWMGESTYLLVEALHAVLFSLMLLSSQQMLRTPEERGEGTVRVMFFRFRWRPWIRNTVVLLSAVGVAFFLLLRARPRVECSLSDGKWVTDGIAAQAEYCLMKYPDAGKPCRNSSECEGSCVLTDYRNGDKVVPTAGVCSTYNRPFGCHDYLEYPVVRSICVD
jgi:hypothetical protein